MRRKVQYKKGIFFYLLLLPLLAVLIVGAGSYRIYINEMEKRLNISLEAAGEQLENRVDNVVYNISKLYLEAADSTAVKELARKDARDIFYVGLKDTLQELQGPYYLRDYIDGFSLINIEYGWVLSNRGLYSLDDALNKAEVESLFQIAADHGLQNSWWMNQPEDNLGIEKINRLEVNLRGLTRVIKVPPMARDCTSLLVVNINMQKLSGLISEGIGEYGMTVLDEAGLLVYTNQNDQEELNEVFKAGNNAKNSGMIIGEEGRSLRMAVSKSAASGWVYVASYDRSIVSQGAKEILILAILVVAVLSAVFIMALYGTEKIYYPVSQLVKYALNLNEEPGENQEDTEQKEKNQNEFLYISKTMNKLASSKADLEIMLEEQKIQLQELLMHRILAGEISADIIPARAQQLGLKHTGCLYVVSTAVRANMEEIVPQDTQQDIISLALVKNIPDKLTSFLLLRPFWNGTVIFSVLCGEDKEALQENVMKYQHDLAVYATQEYKCQVYSGVSDLFFELSHSREAYRESLEALKNNELLKKDSEQVVREKYDLVFYSDFTARYKKALHCDLSYEAQIRDAVVNGELDRAFAVTDNFVNALIENKVILQERTLALYKYLVAILSVAGQVGLSVNEIFEEKDKDLFSMISVIYEGDQIRNFYKRKVISPLISRLNLFREGSVDSVLNRVISLVKEREGNITLAECADNLGHHPSYIWKIMTSRMNVTFSEYLAAYKLELAKKMLLETEMTVAEIAERLNYTSAQNFNRFFTKYENVSPGKYRKMNKG